jgi:ketosteroid isomerase-like protein
MIARNLRTFGLAVAIMTVVAFVTLGMPADRDEDGLRSLVPKIVNAWGSLNISNVDPYYATDADFTYFDIAPMKYNNWAEYRQGVQKAFFDPNQNIKATVTDLRVHTRGSLAWATFIAGLDITPKQGSPSHLDARWTMVLEKRPKGWIVVHEHVSAPLGGS